MSHPLESRDDGQLTIETAIANLQGEDLGLRVYAAWWLGRFRVNTESAIQVLIEALMDEDDRTEAGGYPLRRNAARALGKLGDQQAVSPLIHSLECTDFYVREAAAKALEQLGAAVAIAPLLALLQGQVQGTLPAAEPPYLTQPFDAIIEALGTLRAVEAKADIVPFLEHAVPRIRYAASRALYQLAPNPQDARQYGEQLVAALASEDLQLRRAVLADLGAIGYLPAAEAIAETLAENSLKLIALKGLLEKELAHTTAPELSAGAQHVMSLMDGLL
ncbi:MAG: HEAT repeat domain-containing protein [Cyanobacteria bacterium J06638_20]